MKSFKKRFLGFALAGAFALGIAVSFIPLEASAELSTGGSIFGNKIPCWSSGSVNPEFTYVNCASCTQVPGEWDSGEGTCKPGNND